MCRSMPTASADWPGTRSPRLPIDGVFLRGFRWLRSDSAESLGGLAVGHGSEENGPKAPAVGPLVTANSASVTANAQKQKCAHRRDDVTTMQLWHASIRMPQQILAQVVLAEAVLA